MPNKANTAPMMVREMALNTLHDHRVGLTDEVLVSLYRTALDGQISDHYLHNLLRAGRKLHRPNAEVIEKVLPNMTPKYAAYVAGHIDTPELAELAWKLRKGKQMAKALASSEGMCPVLAAKLLQYCRKHFDAEVVFLLLQRGLVPLAEVIAVLAEDPSYQAEMLDHEHGYRRIGAVVGRAAAGQLDLEHLIMSRPFEWPYHTMAEALLAAVPNERRRELLALVPDLQARVGLFVTLDGRLGVAEAHQLLELAAGIDRYWNPPVTLRFDAEAQALLATGPTRQVVGLLLQDGALERETKAQLIETISKMSDRRVLYAQLLHLVLADAELSEALLFRWRVRPFNPHMGQIGGKAFPEEVTRWLCAQAATTAEPALAVGLLTTLLPDWEGTAVELRDTVSTLF
jgi:hypothetical protein